MKQNNFLRIGVPLMMVATLLLGIALGRCLPGRHIGSISAADKVNEILSLIQDEYVDEVNLDSLLDETIPSLLANLDPHTAYIPAKYFDEVNSELEGSFSGIGISFQVMNDTITVLEVISGGPSEKVGLMAGDRIVQVNDSTVAGVKIQSDDVMKLLRGPADTKVKLQIKRSSSAKPLTYTVTRGDIPVTSIDASYMIAPSVGYIKVNKFGRTTFQEFFTEMLMLKADGAKSFILDLRGNSGGFLDTAIRMANEFLSAGQVIVSTRGRNGELLETVHADGTGSFKSEPLTLLLDEFSASASEILGGAIQDNDRGTIVGRRSFGKGLVQVQHDLTDGSALRLTTARYYTPSGRCIQKPFKKGDLDNYQLEVYDRYLSGEAFSADSVKPDSTLLFHTLSGREVYGGGGIMPDVFVPSDTIGMTSYVTAVFNAALPHRFAFNYVDAHRADLEAISSADELLQTLPADGQLLSDFVQFAAASGVPARWYYINQSRPLLLNHLKALIARDALGTAAYYEIINSSDPAIQRALKVYGFKGL